MVTFCYTRFIRHKRFATLAKTVERQFPVGKAPATVIICGDRYKRDIPAEWEGRRIKNACWPKKSDALGVLHSQVGEAAEHLADNGVPTQFCQDGTGRCIVESNQHQNRIMEVLGIHDRDACYSQRTRP
jgi:hypothetical protein